MQNPPGNAQCRNIAIVSAIVIGSLMGPALGVAFPTATLAVTAGGNAVNALSGLLTNFFTAAWVQRRAERLAGPAYAHPNHDLTRLLGDALARALTRCAEADFQNASWYRALAECAEQHYADIADYTAFDSVATNQLPRLFEAAARNEHKSITLLDDLRYVERFRQKRTVAWLLVERLRELSRQKPCPTLEVTAENSIVTGLFGDIREMVKRNPSRGGRAYAALQIDINGEMLARLGELIEGNRQLFDELRKTGDGIAQMRRSLIGEANRLYYCDLSEDQRFALKVVLDETLAQGERMQRMEDKIDQILNNTEIVRLNQETERHKLDEIKQLLLQRAANSLLMGGPGPQAIEPSELSEADRESLRLAKTSPTLIVQLNALLLERDYRGFDKLLDNATFRQETEDTFRLLTAVGDRWYFAGEPDKAHGPYEQAHALRPDDIATTIFLAILHARTSVGDIVAHRRRAIELAEGNLGVQPREDTSQESPQHTLLKGVLALTLGDLVGHFCKERREADALSAFNELDALRTKYSSPVLVQEVLPRATLNIVSLMIDNGDPKQAIKLNDELLANPNISTIARTTAVANRARIRRTFGI